MQNKHYVLYCYKCNTESPKDLVYCKICGAVLLLQVNEEYDKYVVKSPTKESKKSSMPVLAKHESINNTNTDTTLDEVIARMLQEDEKDYEADLKKAKCDENQSLFANFLEHNVIHFPAFLSKTEQKLVLEDCIDKLSLKSMPGLSYKKLSGPSHGFSYKTGWIADDKSEVVPCCIELAKNQHEKFITKNKDAINKLNNNQEDPKLRIPKDFDSGSLLARMYGPKNGLGFHVDPPGCGWVLVISIGADIDFQYYLKNSDNPYNIQIKSGEAVMFNGEVLYHGIKKVYENTPEWWNEVTKNIEYPFTRIGLQMRIYHI